MSVSICLLRRVNWSAISSMPAICGAWEAIRGNLKFCSLTWYRLVIEEIKDSEVITSYTRWVDAVQVRGAEDQEVFLTFSRRFEHIWLESKKRLMGYVSQKPANIGLRSQYALRLYSWAKKHVSVRTKRISLSLEQLRKVLGLESVKDTDGNIIQEAPLPVCANLRQRERSIHPSGVARRHLGILDFFNNQTVPSHQPQRRF